MKYNLSKLCLKHRSYESGYAQSVEQRKCSKNCVLKKKKTWTKQWRHICVVAAKFRLDKTENYGR